MKASALHAALAALLLATLMVAGSGALRAASPPSGHARPGLAGLLAHDSAWAAWRARFVSPQGRVIDTGNGDISHSEGQGYGMLLAVAAGDQATFERIWGWTRANLMVRDDVLLAWRWEPDKRPAVADMNNATDGDILVAWALTEAAEAWGDAAHRVAARRLAVEIGRKLVVLRGPHAPVLLPGMAGFSAQERPDGPVVNPSYFVFPAFERLPLVAPDIDWAGLSRAGMALVETARFGTPGLPTEWVSLKEAAPRPAAGFAPVFGYNALRVPLYIAWAGLGEARHYAPYRALWESAPPRPGRPGLALVDTADGALFAVVDEPGYAALPALVACAAEGRPLPAGLLAPTPAQNYYPATLHLLALVAAAARTPSCRP